MASASPPHRLAVLFDAVGEDWPSMDLCGQMLLEQLQLQAPYNQRLAAERIQPALPRLARRALRSDASRLALNLDRVAGRYLAYPLRAAALRRRCSLFHVVDHSYAHLVHALPAEHTGVFCHDLDLFRCLLEPRAEPRTAAFRALARTVLRGMQRAALVFHTTAAVRAEIERHGLVDPARLVQAPLGVAPELHPGTDPADRSEALLVPLGGRPFLLHVGADMPRKRLDLLFDLYAAVHRHRPDLWLVQLGGALGPTRREQVARLGIQESLLRPPRLDRPTLAGLYRRAALVLVPSDAEGFGLPVLEALATGSAVVASDLPSLCEVGGDAVRYCPPGALSAWTDAVLAALEGEGLVASREQRLARAARFTWAAHARIIAEAYLRLAE